MRRDWESRSDDHDELLAKFAMAISTLAQGELMFPAPFDLGSAAALHANADVGELAGKVFTLAAGRDVGWQVSISMVAGELSREVIDTATTSTGTLIALLEGLLEELCQKHDID